MNVNVDVDVEVWEVRARMKATRMVHRWMLLPCVHRWRLLPYGTGGHCLHVESVDITSI